MSKTDSPSPKFPEGTRVRPAGASAWGTIGRYVPANDEYEVDDANGKTGSDIPRETLEGGTWEIWTSVSPPTLIDSTLTKSVVLIKQDIIARLEELKPLIDEFHRLGEAWNALEGTSFASPPRVKGSTSRRGRPPGSGHRSEQVLKLLKEKGGMSVAEIADAIDVNPNYLYRVLPKLERDGQVTKIARLYHIKES